MKTPKQYEEEISGLNYLLLEQKDTINALTRERDKYKWLLNELAKKIQKDNDGTSNNQLESESGGLG